MVRAITLGVILAGLWLLLSGLFEPFLLAGALFSVILVVYIANRMDVVDQEGLPVQLGFGLVTYLPWLLLEIIKANLAVAKVVVDPRLPISPTVVRFHGLQKTDLGRFIFANSITITPGTITIAVDGEELEVHALVADMVDGMEEGPMNRKIARLESRL